MVGMHEQIWRIDISLHVPLGADERANWDPASSGTGSGHSHLLLPEKWQRKNGRGGRADPPARSRNYWNPGCTS